jgi:hypothetical protein
VVEDGDPVGELVGLVEVLRGQEDGDAAGREVADAVPHLPAAARVEPGRGLVEEDHPRRPGQRHRQVEAAAHPTRVRRDRARGRVGQVEAIEQLCHPTPPGAAAEMVQVGHQLQVLLACEQVVDRRELAGDPDRGPHPIRIADHVVTGYAHLAGVGRNQRRQDPHDRRLAGAVRPEQREDRARRDLEVDPVEDDLAAERLA